MAKRGRPTKLTEEVTRRIINSIRAGNYLETSAAYAGIGKVTLFDWLRRGSRQTCGVHREFWEAVEQALAEAEVRDVYIITKAAERNWQAAAWRLERKFPGRWGRKVEIGSVGSNPDQPRPWIANRDKPNP
jgi:hypothetical protein